MLDSDLLVVAGEASGDLHGARLLAELRLLRPRLRAFGMGGEELRRAGLDCIADAGEISVVGITEVLKILPRARQLFRRLLAEVDRRKPSLALLIDFPDFNLRLARRLKRRGLRVVYYISPQVWAWRRRRVGGIARWVDRMLVLFPFEVDFYRRYGVEAIHVGHPLVDEVPALPQVWDGLAAEKGNEERRIALLPGSRPSEVSALLPAMLAAARRLGGEVPLAIRLIQAPGLPATLFAEAIRGSGLEVILVSEDRFGAIAGSHLALCASGTATLEVGLLRTPMIVVYRVGRLTYALARLLVRLPYYSLVNLVLGRKAVPELLQGEATAERIAAEAAALLRDPAAIGAQRHALAGLRERLGEGGASRRAAREVAGLLGEAA